MPLLTAKQRRANRNCVVLLVKRKISNKHVLVFQILLLVGTKLEIVIMEMAKEIQDKATVIKGGPIVEPSDRFFWFNRPQWVLFLIHLTLFQNAFQMAHFIWTLVGFFQFIIHQPKPKPKPSVCS
jgi:hypothetical protein